MVAQPGEASSSLESGACEHSRSSREDVGSWEGVSGTPANLPKSGPGKEKKRAISQTGGTHRHIWERKVVDAKHDSQPERCPSHSSPAFHLEIEGAPPRLLNSTVSMYSSVCSRTHSLE